jgi:hypothetical protein
MHRSRNEGAPAAELTAGNAAPPAEGFGTLARNPERPSTIGTGRSDPPMKNSRCFRGSANLVEQVPARPQIEEMPKITPYVSGSKLPA